MLRHNGNEDHFKRFKVSFVIDIRISPVVANKHSRDLFVSFNSISIFLDSNKKRLESILYREFIIFVS